MDNEAFLQRFAIQSFRDTADEDYIAARMAFRARLAYAAIWASQQAVEKYIKCILLLARIPAKNIGHDINAGLKLAKDHGVDLNLVPPTISLLDELSTFGEFRYLEVSRIAFSRQIFDLDRAVWELRRFCSLDLSLRELTLKPQKLAPRYSLPGGVLEEVLEKGHRHSVDAILWSNAYIGKRKRTKVRTQRWIKTKNAPLLHHPE